MTVYPLLRFQKGKNEIDFNGLSRLEKLDKGEYSAIALAYAGLKRLGLEERRRHVREL